MVLFPGWQRWKGVAMSAKVNVSNVEVLNNPAPFHANFQFQITFECFEPLPNGSFSSL